MKNLFQSKTFLWTTIFIVLLLGGDEALKRISENLDITYTQVIDILIATGAIAGCGYGRLKGDNTVYTPKGFPGKDKPVIYFEDEDQDAIDDSPLSE